MTLLSVSALALGSAVSLGLARFSYAFLLPAMRADLGWSYFTGGAMNTVNAAGYLLGALAVSRWLDRLGPRVLDLGFSAINSMDVREISAPHLQQLSDETGHTVNMAILDGVDIVYIERCRASRPGQREIDLNLHIGARLPAYCTAMGKAMLAFLPEDSLAPILEDLDLLERGPNTITDEAAFRAELAGIRATGIAVNDEELAYGLRSIAAPIYSQSGDVLAALNLAIHRTIVSMEELVERFAPAVIQTANDISLSMGHRLAPA